MQHFTTDALILRVTDRGDHDKLLMVIAKDYGRFYAILKNTHALFRNELSATEPFTYSNLEFYEKNGVKWVKNPVAIENFFGMRYDMDKLFLATYLAEVTAELSDEREPAGEILQLTLNAFHKLSRTTGENAHIKAVFEMRAAAISGFMPNLCTCRSCGKAPAGDLFLDVMDGHLVCAECLHKQSALTPLPEVNELGQRTVLCPLTAASAMALRYVCEADPRRIFAFQLTDELSKMTFSRAAETYLLHHLGRGFPSLDNYKKIQTITKRAGHENAAPPTPKGDPD